MHQEFLKNIDEVIGARPFRDDWDSLAHFKILPGIGRKIPGFSFTGASIQCQLSAMNGIRAICTSQGRRNSSIIVPPMERSASSVIRISFRNLRPKTLTTGLGRSLSEIRRPLCRPGCRASRWFPDVCQRHWDWNAAKMGPKRDVLGELAKALRAKGLVFSVSTIRSRAFLLL